MIEMLVSVTVLAMIVVMTTQLINSTSTVTVASGRSSDSDTQIRCIFDRMEADLNCALNRDDIDFYVNKKSGNDEIYFYTEVNGYYPQGDLALSTGLSDRNTVALVGYRVNSATGFDLERLSRGLHWGDPSPETDNYTSVVFLPLMIKNCFSKAIANQTNTSTDLISQWDVIGNGVFRCELSFLLTTGTISQYPYINGSASTSSTRLQRSDVVAVAVTIATVDKGSRAMLSNSTTSLTSLAALLDDATDAAPGSATTAENWIKIINNNAGSPPVGVPKAVMSGIHVYQRLFYLNGQSVSGT